MSQVFETNARSILSRTAGFLAEAGFTHSLTPARNCTYGCTYCYVPTMGIYGGLRPDDWTHWGQFTTQKINAAQLLRQQLRPGQIIYCSPLVDPYQPAEREHPLMPGVLQAVMENPPAIFVVQTRGPLITRDLNLLTQLAGRTRLRISFSLTTDREDIRRRYEPNCESIQERLAAMRTLSEAGLAVHATLAPLLPCNPERLANMALEVTSRNIICDPLHTRQTKQRGATTRKVAYDLAARFDESSWLDPEFQQSIVQRIAAVADEHGREFGVGTTGFKWLATY